MLFNKDNGELQVKYTENRNAFFKTGVSLEWKDSKFPCPLLLCFFFTSTQVTIVSWQAMMRRNPRSYPPYHWEMITLLEANIWKLKIDPASFSSRNQWFGVPWGSLLAFKDVRTVRCKHHWESWTHPKRSKRLNNNTVLGRWWAPATGGPCVRRLFWSAAAWKGSRAEWTIPPAERNPGGAWLGSMFRLNSRMS